MVDSHLNREIDIMEYVFHLNTEDLFQFRQWYINHPACKLIDEVRAIVRNGSREIESKEDGIG
jgi:hypothetical protein